MTTGTIAALVAAGALVALVGPKLRARLILSRAKHRSLAGHSRLSRRIAALLPRYAYDDAAFFSADDAGAAIADRRRAAFERLSGEMRSAGVRTVERTAEATPFISDLQFTESYRVPFQFSPRVQRAAAGRLVRRNRRTACRSPISTAPRATTSPAPTA